MRHRCHRCDLSLDAPSWGKCPGCGGPLYLDLSNRGKPAPVLYPALAAGKAALKSGMLRYDGRPNLETRDARREAHIHYGYNFSDKDPADYEPGGIFGNEKDEDGSPVSSS